ncbi:MAG: ATP-binding cassette domain-containing protein [Deltaproteobacteria bacterium]|nr:ATP-binding cassette domain-containing protein [Deltaproteobacteria bacterium]
MIEARALSKHFGATRALQEISFKVARGEIVGFLGPNGAGKTTTMRILTGFLRPTSGSAWIGGIDVSADPLTTRGRVGYLPESNPLYADMMVIDYLNYVADMRSIPVESRQKRLHEIGERCGLMKVLGKDIGQLSKGFRQRVGLAQAMIHDPDILILDEPTSGLDPNQIVEIRELIKDLGREKTVVLSTHILPEVEATCSRIIIVADGKLVANDTAAALSERKSGAIIRVTVKGKNGSALDLAKVKGVLAGVDGVRSVDVTEGEGGPAVGFKLQSAGEADPREALFHAAVQNDLVLLDLHREHLSLEDVFRRLTRGEGGSHA